MGKGFYVFGQARVGGSCNSLENGYTNNQATSYDKTTGYNAAINIYPGVSYSINRKLQLETGFNNLAYLSFDHSKRIENFNGGVSVVSNTFGLGSSLSSLSGFTLGFRVFFMDNILQNLLHRPGQNSFLCVSIIRRTYVGVYSAICTEK